MKVELYFYSPYGPYGLYRVSVPVQGGTFAMYLHKLDRVPQPVQRLATG
jgi:hypothetical protein